MNAVSPQDYGDMTDDEILGMEAPAPALEPVEDPEPVVELAPVEAVAEPVAEVLEVEPIVDPADAAPLNVDADSDEAIAAAQTAPAEIDPSDPATPKQTKAPEPTSDPETTAEGVTEPAAEAEPKSIDYEAAYKQIMSPFKANGRDFAPASADEAIRLMQMGTNYTKKMQTLAPSLKLMKMLENNGLLEEGKINHLIDLDKKDPEAIRKLLHDGSVDPMDIDTTAPLAYTPGNHSVSDQEMAFSDTLGDVMSTPEGKETVTLINNSWDQASKEALYNEPGVLKIITEQRANGVYDRISTEIDRQRTLGMLTNVPFIQAYKQVGDALYAPEAQPQPAPAPAAAVPVPAPAVLATRPARLQNAVVNSDKAKAASSVRSTPASAPKAFDPFSMTDEQIMAITSPG